MFRLHALVWIALFLVATTQPLASQADSGRRGFPPGASGRQVATVLWGEAFPERISPDRTRS